MTTQLFNFTRALETAKADPFVQQFLTVNRAQLEALALDAAERILDLIAAGQAREGMTAFYAAAPLATVAQGAAQDVTGTAALAQRAADAKASLLAFSEAAVRALITLLVAGFCV